MFCESIQQRHKAYRCVIHQVRFLNLDNKTRPGNIRPRFVIIDV